MAYSFERSKRPNIDFGIQQQQQQTLCNEQPFYPEYDINYIKYLFGINNLQEQIIFYRSSYNCRTFFFRSLNILKSFSFSWIPR